MRRLKGARGVRVLSAVLCACALVAGAGRGAAAQGVRYEPRGAGFSATFPAEPQTRSETQEFGTLIMKAYGYGVDHEGMAYFVSWFGDMPPAAARDPRMEEILYTRLEQVYTRMGTVIGRGEASVAGHSNVSLGGRSSRPKSDMVFNCHRVGARGAGASARPTSFTHQARCPEIVSQSCFSPFSRSS